MAQELTSFLIRSFSHYRPAERPKRLESIQKTLGLQCTQVVFAVDEETQIYEAQNQNAPLTIASDLLKLGSLSDMRFIPGEAETSLALTVYSTKSQRNRLDADAQGPFYNDGWVIEGTRKGRQSIDFNWRTQTIPDRELNLDPGLAPEENLGACKHELLAKSPLLEVWMSGHKIHIYETQTVGVPKREIFRKRVSMFRHFEPHVYDDVHQILYVMVDCDGSYQHTLTAIDVSERFSAELLESKAIDTSDDESNINTAKHRVRYLEKVRNTRSFTIDLKRRRGYFIFSTDDSNDLTSSLYELNLSGVHERMFSQKILQDSSLDLNIPLNSEWLSQVIERIVEVKKPSRRDHNMHSAGPYLAMVNLAVTYYEEYNSGGFITDPGEVLIYCKTRLEQVLSLQLKARSYYDPEFCEGSDNSVLEALYQDTANIDIIGLVFAFHRVTFILFDRRKIKKQPTAFVTKHITLGISYIDRCLPDISARSLRRRIFAPTKYLVLRKVDATSRGAARRVYNEEVEEELDVFQYEALAAKSIQLLEQFVIKF